MPLYEYACRKCGKHVERIEKFSGPHLRKCPTCGGSVERLVSAPAIQFKGTGWYVTDYARSSSGGNSEKGASEKSENSATSEKSDSGSESKQDGKAPAKDSKETKEKKKAPAKAK